MRSSIWYRGGGVVGAQQGEVLESQKDDGKLSLLRKEWPTQKVEI